MPDDGKLKIFISWSGEKSRLVAVALREWLPLLFDGIEPWVSSEDIAAGARSMQDIETALNESFFAIVVLTTANQHKPWINFEAGAIGKTFGPHSKSHVVPLLVDIDKGQVTGPLTQFQMSLLDRNGIEHLVRTIAGLRAVPAGVAETRLAGTWSSFWSGVEVAKQLDDGAVVVTRTTEDMLDEILAHVRQLTVNASMDGLRGEAERLRRRREALYSEFAGSSRVSSEQLDMIAGLANIGPILEALRIAEASDRERGISREVPPDPSAESS